MTSQLPYRLGRALGTGGYAEVFEAVPRGGSGGPVALKRGLGQTKEGAARLRREIKVQRDLDHPNVMPILDADPIGEWYTMPIAEGSLLSLWKNGKVGTSAQDLALAVIDQAGQGLEYAHDQGYLHRDVTPGNILGYRQADGGLLWVVGDWGMVRRPLGMTSRPLTDGEGLGTAGFAAPETYQGDAHVVDERADVYSLARVVAWILNGGWPTPNLPSRVDGSLRGFVDECTDLNANRRPATMQEMRQRLAELTSEPPMSHRGQVQALLETVDTDRSAAGRAIDIALRHVDSDEIWLDEIARIPLDAVRDFARQLPDRSSEASLVMLEHLTSDARRDRGYDYLNTPLRWAHEVLRVLTETGHLGLAEDVAVQSFARELEWDRWKQKRITVDWLRSLEEPEGAVMRRAIRQSGARDYYATELGTGRILSRSLAAEFGR